MCRLLLGCALWAIASTGLAQAPGDPESPSRAYLVLDIGGHSAKPIDLVFTPDSKKLISSAEDRTVQVWDVATRERLQIFRLPPSSGNAHNLAVDRKGERIVYWVEGKKVRTSFVCSLETGRMQALKPAGHSLFTPDGKSLVVMDGHQLHLVEIETGMTLLSAKLLPEKSQKKFVHAQFSPDGTTLAAVAEDERVLLVDPATLKVRKTLTVRGTNDLRNVNWANDQTIVCRSNSAEKALAVVDIGTGRLLQSFTRDKLLSKVPPKGSSEHLVNSHALAGTTKVFIRTHSQHEKRYEVSYVLDWDSGAMTPAFTLSNPYGCKATAIAPDQSIAVQGDSDNNEIILWNPKTGKALKKGNNDLALRSAVHGAKGWWWSIRWRPDGKALAYEKMLDNSGGGHAEFDLTTLTLRSLEHAKFLKYGEQNAANVLGKKKPSEEAAKTDMHERGLTFTWDALNLSFPYPHLKITGGPSTVMIKDLNPVMWDYSFVAGGQIASSVYYSRHLLLHDSATGKLLFDKAVVHSFVQALAVSPKPECRYILIGSSDQTLTVFNPIARKVILTVFPAGRDWIAWTPEGYYAATPGGQRLMGWSVDNGPDQPASFYPADRFPALYRPDVIKLVFAKGDVAEALAAANAALPAERRPKTNAVVNVADLLPPKTTLKLVSKNDEGLVKLSAVLDAGARSEPVQSMRLMVDGRPAAGPGFFKEFDKAPATGTINWPDLQLPPGKHQVVVLVRTGDASVVSNNLEIDTRPAKDRPTLHVLAVGVSKYNDQGLDLAAAANDATLIAKTFENCKGPLFGEVRTNVLCDKQATRKGVLDAIARLRTDPDPKNKVKDGDLIVVFFAGHGVMNQEGEFFLLPHDTDLSQLAKTALPGAKLQDELKAMPCQVLLMMDACHSAGYGPKGKLQQNNLPPGTDVATRKMTDDEVAVVVMCAAMANEKAFERKGNGLFTRALVDALQNADVPHNTFNRKQYLHHLQSYVFDHVLAESDNRQHPFLHTPWTVESFPIREVPEGTPPKR